MRLEAAAAEQQRRRKKATWGRPRCRSSAASSSSFLLSFLPGWKHRETIKGQPKSDETGIFLSSSNLNNYQCLLTYRNVNTLSNLSNKFMLKNRPGPQKWAEYLPHFESGILRFLTQILLLSLQDNFWNSKMSSSNIILDSVVDL